MFDIYDVRYSLQFPAAGSHHRTPTGLRILFTVQKSSFSATSKPIDSSHWERYFRCSTHEGPWTFHGRSSALLFSYRSSWVMSALFSFSGETDSSLWIGTSQDRKSTFLRLCLLHALWYTAIVPSLMFYTDRYTYFLSPELSQVTCKSSTQSTFHDRIGRWSHLASFSRWPVSIDAWVLDLVLSSHWLRSTRPFAPSCSAQSSYSSVPSYF